MSKTTEVPDDASASESRPESPPDETDEEPSTAKAKRGSSLTIELHTPMLVVTLVGGIVAAITGAALGSVQSESSPLPDWVVVVSAVGLALVALGLAWAVEARDQANRRRSKEIRDRVRSAEDGLSKAIEETVHADDPDDRRLDEALFLSRVWQSVTARLDQYHDDAQSQGRRAFNAAMAAMSVGFLITVGCGAVAVFLATTNTGAVVIGSLGAVSAALAGFVARTYLRAYESVSGQLQGYFSQPVEASRYLSAERAIHVSGLPEDARRDLMKALVSAMVVPPKPEGAVSENRA